MQNNKIRVYTVHVVYSAYKLEKPVNNNNNNNNNKNCEMEEVCPKHIFVLLWFLSLPLLLFALFRTAEWTSAGAALLLFRLCCVILGAVFWCLCSIPV